MQEKIQNDLKDAMKARDELRMSVLRMLSSAIHNREIAARSAGEPRQGREKKSKGEEKPALTDEEIVAVIRSEVKKRRDAAEGFTKGGRTDAAEKERAEAKILEGYLPAELPDEEVEKAVREVIAEMGEVSMKEFGKIMGGAMKRLGGQASGDRVSATVKKMIQS